MNKKQEIIKVNFNNLDSIKKGELKKLELENKGYSLIKMCPYGYDKFNIIFEKVK